MAKYVKLLCLANSRKLGNRCIAGINLGTNKWFRPVNDGGCALRNPDIRFDNYLSPQVLDVIEIPVIRPEPLPYQPENWVIDKEYYWRKIGVANINRLDRYLDNDEYILRDRADCISAQKLVANPITKSLTLIKISPITFQKKWSVTGKAQVRAKFKYRSNQYSLGVTDPLWEKQFFQRDGTFWEIGDYPFKGTFYLVISLGEAFQGYHYKLVVAVIPMV